VTISKNITLQDTAPPSSVMNLNNQSQGTRWIFWNWTNPTDVDFNSSIIYLDGVNIVNTSNNYYNATGLTSNTNYTIILNTKDTTGNVNYADVSNTATTQTSLPTTIFFDGFESASLTTNNWTTTGWSISTGNVYSGSYKAQATAQQSNELYVNISTEGYSNISWTFYYGTGGSYVGNGYTASWWNGTAWKQVMITNQVADYQRGEYNLTSDADNNTNFGLRYICYPTSNNRRCRLDNVNITGIII
jgi:hypothetical protein